jgi:hypothetical protein
VVRGSGSPITVRVIGGAGDDVLVDSTAAPAGRTILYDQAGSNRFDNPGGARIDERPWDHPVVTDYQAHKGAARDFGSRARVQTRVGYGDGAGPIVSLGGHLEEYAFRRLPFARRLSGWGSVGTANGGLGLSAVWHERFEGSDRGLVTTLRASRRLATGGFYGFGNGTAATAAEPAFTGDEIAADALYEIRLGGEDDVIGLGPTVRWLDPRAAPAGPLATLRPLGWDGFGEVGLAARLKLDRVERAGLAVSGLGVEASARVGAPVWDAPGWFAHAALAASAYVPAPDSSTLALRAGAVTASGRYPFHEAAYLGGLPSLRGFAFDRLAGDAAVYGGAEWSVPLGRLTLLTRGDVGVLGLVDAGRVWMDGRSPGGWHAGVGGGVWYRTLGVRVSAAVARGEKTGLYLDAGLPF